MYYIFCAAKPVSHLPANRDLTRALARTTMKCVVIRVSSEDEPEKSCCSVTNGGEGTSLVNFPPVVSASVHVLESGWVRSFGAILGCCEYNYMLRRIGNDGAQGDMRCIYSVMTLDGQWTSALISATTLKLDCGYDMLHKPIRSSTRFETESRT